MNKEDLCTYEQALVLKKLGFTYPTYYYIDEEDMKWYTDGEGYFINWNNGTSDIVSIPTLAQAQKWLIYKSLYVRPIIFRPMTDWKYVITKTSEIKSISSIIFSSYEEALSAGIDECLKLLEK